MSDLVRRAQCREILAQAYEAVHGPGGIHAHKIRAANRPGDTSFIDVEIALDAMENMIAILTNGNSNAPSTS